MEKYFEVITNSQTGKVTTRPYTDKEIAEVQRLHNLQLSATVRSTRDELLAASDWTQVIDSPVNKVEWAEYRQALRDVPSQPTFPNSVVWPTEPN